MTDEELDRGPRQPALPATEGKQRPSRSFWETKVGGMVTLPVAPPEKEGEEGPARPEDALFLSFVFSLVLFFFSVLGRRRMGSPTLMAPRSFAEDCRMGGDGKRGKKHAGYHHGCCRGHGSSGRI